MGRMDLSSVSSGRRRDPYRVGIYGPPGAGKTRFAAGAPACVVIPVEDGAGRYDATAFPRPATWQDVKDAIRELRTGKHQFKTLALDTIDAAEPLCWKHVAQAAGKADVEAFGYGKGYQAAADEFRVLLADLEALQAERGMNVILSCHAAVRSFKNPTGDDYDRWTLRLHEKAAAAVKDWVEALLFATHDDLAAKGDGGKTMGVSTGRRLLRTRHSAGYEAKSRIDLPDPIVLSADPTKNWDAFAAEAEVGTMPHKELLAAFAAAVGENAKAKEWHASGKAAEASEADLRAALRQLRRK